MTPGLLLLHGFSGAPRSWQPVTEALGPDVELLVPALAGHHGAPPARGFEHELERLAQLLDPERPWIACGYSLGARLGLGLLQRYPARFRAAVLIGLNPGLESEAARAVRSAADERWASLLERAGIDAFAEAWASQPLFATQAALPGERRDERRRIRTAHRPDALAQSLRALGLSAMRNYWPSLPGIDVSVELLAGEVDTKFVEIALRAERALPRARLRVVPGAGHDLLLERPEAVADVIRAVHDGL